MLDFVEPLESRRLLSAVTIAAADVKLMADVQTLTANANMAQTAVLNAGNQFKAAVQSLHLKNSSLKTALQKDITASSSKIEGDVSKIISAGSSGEQKVMADVLHITVLDSGNAAKTIADQRRLGADLESLQIVETPLLGKLASDIGNTITQINGAVHAIVVANAGQQGLQSAWTKLSNAFQSSERTLFPEVVDVVVDLDALSTAG